MPAISLLASVCLLFLKLWVTIVTGWPSTTICQALPVQQRPVQPQGGYQQPAQPQQRTPMEPPIDFDDDIPF